MNCPRCHLANPDEARFCGHCGNSMVAFSVPLTNAASGATVDTPLDKKAQHNAQRGHTALHNSINNTLQTVIEFIGRIGADPDDSEDTRLQKTLLVFSSLMMASLAAMMWGPIYLISGEYLAGAIPLSYGVISFFSIALFARIRQYQFFRTSQLLLSLLLPFFLMLALGGFVNSSGVVLWSLTSPLGALVFAGRRQAMGWFFAFLVLVTIAAVLEPYVSRTSNLPFMLQIVFYVMNIGATSTVAFVLLQYFVGQKDATLNLLNIEQEKSEKLLLNILPAQIAEILKSDSRTIADCYEMASVLFADVVNFTPMSARMTPVELVDLLNEVFSYFDHLVGKYGLEKIKTIGDCYMVAAGVPRPRPDHAHALVNMALETQEYFSRHEFGGMQLSLRIGINSGPVVAGVIGCTKFIYDLWGDTVNTASRMESHGVGGRVQISGSTYNLIHRDYICESRGMVEIKGKGKMEVWHVVGKNG